MTWTRIVRVILRYRLSILIIVGLITIFMGYMAVKVQMTYEMSALLPEKDSTFQSYQDDLLMWGRDCYFAAGAIDSAAIAHVLDQSNYT